MQQSSIKSQSVLESNFWRKFRVQHIIMPKSDSCLKSNLWSLRIRCGNNANRPRRANQQSCSPAAFERSADSHAGILKPVKSRWLSVTRCGRRLFLRWTVNDFWDFLSVCTWNACCWTNIIYAPAYESFLRCRDVSGIFSYEKVEIIVGPLSAWIMGKINNYW